MRSRRTGMPAIGGYWLSPERIAASTASSSRGSQSKSGKPWPRLTAPRSCASADITVKIVVPTVGRRVVTAGVLGSAGSRTFTWKFSQLVVVGVAGHRALDQRPGQAIGRHLGEGVDEVAQVRAALERDPGDVLAEQVADRSRDEVAARAFLAHRDLGDDADAQTKTDV